jgi:hypothetical protein
VHLASRSVPWLPRIDNQHRTASPTEGESAAQSGSPASNDHHVEPRPLLVSGTGHLYLLIHGTTVPPRAPT